jgi:photosystem II stability/assembly factor-like uncharacterized protein
MVKTTDGGQNWTEMVSGTTNDLFAVQFPTGAVTGYAGGVYHTFLKTTDAGVSWSSPGAVPPISVFAIDFPTDDAVGFIAGYPADTVWKTTDGGANWTGHANDASGNYALRSLCFPSGRDTGCAAGDHGVILKTTDAGVTWAAQASQTQYALLSIDFPTNTDTGFVCGGAYPNSVVGRTYNGAGWNTWNPGTWNVLRSMSFGGQNFVGYAAGDRGNVYKTTDVGISWNLQRPVSDAPLFSVCFPVDSDTGFAVGGGGAIIKTTDGGEIWVAEERQPSPRLRPATGPTIVRGVLFLQGDCPRTGTVPKTVLLDISGRKVLDLHAGANDLRMLAPGVYFIRATAGRGPSAASKVVIQK